MITSRLFGVALAACAFAGPALATETPVNEAASAPTTLTKPSELVTAMDCDPSIQGACAALEPDASATAVQTLETPGTKLPPEANEG